MDKPRETINSNQNHDHNHGLANKKWIRNAIIVMLADIVFTYFAFFLALLLRFDFSFDKIELKSIQSRFFSSISGNH